MQTLGVCFVLPSFVVNTYNRKEKTETKQDELRQKLIDGTIHVIAKDGLDRASTKQIGLATATNEAYIYRLFESKEDLLTKTFTALDEELVSKALQHLPVMYMHDIEFETRCRFYFVAIWDFLLGNREKCLAFIRYYYSPYFARCSSEEHTQRFLPLVKKFSDAFLDESNVWMILNHILTTMLDFAVKVYDGAVPNDEDTAEHVFRLIYASIRQYFKNKERKVS